MGKFSNRESVPPNYSKASLAFDAMFIVIIRFEFRIKSLQGVWIDMR